MRWFISIRYLLTHLRQSLVCVAGVTISVMMFITMTSMMQGFTDKFIIETVESSGHITVKDEPRATETPILERAEPDANAVRSFLRVKPREKIDKIRNPIGLIEHIKRLPGVLDAAPLVHGDAVLSYGTKTYSIQIYGVDPRAQVAVTTIGEKVTQGAFDRLKKTADGIVLGRGIAITLGVHIDDNITLSSPTGGEKNVKVGGLFCIGD